MTFEHMRVAHIVPRMSIGGVETAISRSIADLQKRHDYRIFCVRGRGSIDAGQRGVGRLLLASILKSWKPDIVITSLWWAHPFGRALRLFGCKWIAFHHNTGFSHFIDKAVLRWSWKSADEVFVDSKTTGETLGAQCGARPYAVVPYVFHAADSTNEEGDLWRTRPYDFVWVGRTSAIKRLDVLLRFVRHVHARGWDARFLVCAAGPIPPDLTNCAASAPELMHIHQDVHNAEVRSLLKKSKFYLLFSDHEGMSMSTIEAIQAGCIPIVRPVGEVPRYVSADVGILLTSVEEADLRVAASRVQDLVTRCDEVHAMNAAGRTAVDGIPGYVESLLLAIGK